MPTKIEWCDETFNPWWGCERVSPACAHCYADTFARRIGMPDLWAEKDHRAEHGFRFFGDKHWEEPLRWARTLPEKLGRRPRVFCASMADVFEDRAEVAEPRSRLFIDVIAATPEMDWLVLTKRPEFAREWLRGFYADEIPEETPFSNLWLGVSIENARYTWRADVLRDTPAAVRFISAEPLLGSLFAGPSECEICGGRGGELGRMRDSINGHVFAHRDCWQRDPACKQWVPAQRSPLDLAGIDWVIIGGESGPGSRPFHLEHAREIIDATGSHYLEHGDAPAIFVKQLGAKPIADLGARDGCGVPVPLDLVLSDRKGGDMDEWPSDLRVREFPASLVAV